MLTMKWKSSKQVPQYEKKFKGHSFVSFKNHNALPEGEV